MTLEVFRAGSPVFELEVNDTFMFSQTLMQEHRITVPSYESINPLPVQINDYIIYNGIKYTINTVPDILIKNTFVYSMVFEGPEYTMYDKILMHEGAADFPYFGTALDHLTLLLENINTIDPGWTAGVVDTTDPIFVDYVNMNCRVALTTIAEKFALEYSFDNKQINIVKQVGNVTTHVFEYGIFKGLYSLTRKYVSEKNVKTKVYGFGSTRNLPAGYRGGATRLTFEERFIERNTDIFGIKEAQFTDEEIFPTREGEVTAAGAIIDDDGKTFTITDNTLDFDLNVYKLAGVEAKIQFNTGELTGEDFIIVRYDHSTKTITANRKVNSSNIQLPSTSFQAAIGDVYILLDIGLPASYVTAAELKVKNATTIFTDENSIPRVEFGLDMDLLFVRDNNVKLKPGDKVQIVNTSLGINDQIRALTVSFPISFPEILTKESKYSVTIANFISYNVQERLQAVVVDNKTNIKIVDRRSVEMARRNTSNFRDLQDLIFDPDNYFDTGNIKPGSIETGMLSIGVKSQNFMLKEVTFQFNYNGDPNAVNISNGTLEHLEIDIPGLGYSWVIPTASFSGLDPAKPYYIYAECSTAALTGVWKLSDTPVDFDQVPGKYVFNIGILYKVKTGYRDNYMTYGVTSIVGQNVNTGRIQDITAQNYLDLVTGKFNLGDNTSGMDYGVTTENRLTIRGGFTQNGGGVSAPITTFRGPYVPGVTYYNGDSVTSGGSTWVYKFATPTNDQPPAENTYWTIGAQKGDDGADGGAGATVEIQYSVDGSTSWHSTFTTGDIFMRQRVGSGAWSAPIRIVGEEGEPGADGQYTSFEFTKNTSLTDIPYSGPWTDDPPAIAANEYLWMRSGTFDSIGLVGAWSTPVRISGPQGTPGVEGPPGADGESLYTWIKYGDDASGSGMTDLPDGKSYMGIAYNKPTPSESTNPLDYSWSLVIGEGVPGAPGEDGQSLYTWIKYADTPTTGISDDPTGKIYFGIAYNKTTATESSTYSDYAWSLIKGADGTNGTNGSNGADGNFVEFRFAKNGSTTVPPSLTNTDASPAGWSTTQPTLSVGEYGWMTSALKTPAGALVANWSVATRFTGLQGDPGAPGAAGATGATGSAGPYMNFRGDYNAGATYVGSSVNIQAVKYGGSYYVTRTDAGTIPTGTIPTNTTYWNAFGGEFESVATGLLLATLAYIDNLGVRYLSTGISGEKRAVIDAVQNNIRILNELDKELIVIDDDSAIESSYSNTTPPTANPDGSYPKEYLGSYVVSGTTYYRYANMGPGISVGISPTDANGMVSIGRKGVNFYSTGSEAPSIGFSHAGGAPSTSLSRFGVYTLDLWGADLRITNSIKVVVLGGLGGTTPIEKTGITANIQYATGGAISSTRWFEVVKGVIVSDNAGTKP